MNLTKRINTKNTVLLVVDKQAGYFNPALVHGRNRNLPSNASQILENIDDLVEEARDSGVEVVWTQMIEDAQDSPTVTSEIMKADPDHVYSISKKGTPSFEIYGRTKPATNEKVITKQYYNAFAKTELAEYLSSKGIETVVLAGGYAPRCVLATAIGANSNDFFVVSVKDAVTYQMNTENEVPGLFFFADTLLGSALNSAEIVSIWNK